MQGRADSLMGIATSATQGTVGARELAARPLLRAGEVLETVPGVITTQHAGGGKANQYFQRGFNLDHGTDFATTLDGMPLNLRSHGHGQGYTDMNVVIPELVRRINADWRRADADSSTRVSAWGLRYDLDLYSNFTYFLTDPVLGDQFEQVDERHAVGVDARHFRFAMLAGRRTAVTFGLQFRNDWIDNGLYHARSRRRTGKVDAGSGSRLPAAVRVDEITEASIGLYAESAVQLTGRLRAVAGVRGDFRGFDVASLREENSGDRHAAIGSPKLSLIYAVRPGTEAYLQAGLGFHSSDARGVVTRVDPLTGAVFDGDGNPVTPADSLVRTRGAEGGLRTVALPGLQSTLSLWWLEVASELLFVGDAGATEASRPSRRHGVEWANYWALDESLTLDADFSRSHAAFRDTAPEGDRIPGTIEAVEASGLTWHPPGPWSGALRVRYFGPRPLIEDDSIRSDATLLPGARLGYRVYDARELTAEAFNLLDRDDHDIDYAYESRTTPGGRAATRIHFHPVEPAQVRIGLTARF